MLWSLKCHLISLLFLLFKICLMFGLESLCWQMALSSVTLLVCIWNFLLTSAPLGIPLLMRGWQTRCVKSFRLPVWGWIDQNQLKDMMARWFWNLSLMSYILPSLLKVTRNSLPQCSLCALNIKVLSWGAHEWHITVFGLIWSIIQLSSPHTSVIILKLTIHESGACWSSWKMLLRSRSSRSPQRILRKTQALRFMRSTQQCITHSWNS